MGAVHSYASPEHFWLKYSVPSIDPVTDLPERRKFKMTKIVRMLRDLKSREDASDAAAAHREYADPDEFVKWFSYRKGARKYPLKNIATIARLYRKLKGRPRFWDFEEEQEDTESENEKEFI
jgi:hypothetical protein